MIKPPRLETIVIGKDSTMFDVYIALNSHVGCCRNVKYFIIDSDTPNVTTFNGIPVVSSEQISWYRLDSRTQFLITIDHGDEASYAKWRSFLAEKQFNSISSATVFENNLLTEDGMLNGRRKMLKNFNRYNLSRRSSQYIKRLFDVLLASCMLLVLSPLLILLCILVKRDGGKAIYGHVRIGRAGKKFRCYKFRSMVVNSEQVLSQLLNNCPVARDEWKRDFKLKNDPRITKLGKLLRCTSLDELPQLFNVLRGDMSLVGPRPITEIELNRYAENTKYYLAAKPGITGLWQVSGRNNTNYEQRIYFDCWYVRNWKLSTDIAILFKTALVVLRRDGAY